ncbi:hypothetical protein [Nakamurella panacisegetis]|uniref:hypothetical protein n=1 Tax=Nakamurella panacisegetis TaxID=1090615 RepID=UPI0012FE6624|nr:hypothetical protein [Nakamurella panacisegetis]
MRKPIIWSVAAVVLIGVVVAGVVLAVHAFNSGTVAAGPECTVPSDAPASTSTAAATPVDTYPQAVQLQNASTINAVGMSRGLPQRARIIALATAYQESGLRNLPSGDRDSLGLFQQRPSQGWGTKTQIMDPVYAAGKFYDALVQVKGWQRMSLTKAAQAVQYSGFPAAYAKWEGQAATLAAALGGDAELRLSCIAGAQAPTADAPVRKALAGTGSAPTAIKTVLAAAQAELGGLKVVSVQGSTAVLSVSVPGVSAAQAGRALAAWAVAHSTGFAVTDVSVEAQEWTDHVWQAAPTTRPAGQVSITTS